VAGGPRPRRLGRRHPRRETLLPALGPRALALLPLPLLGDPEASRSRILAQLAGGASARVLHHFRVSIGV
jgi:hypothetical protein